ncbi:Putative MetA-pathway of phenol degradation [Bryocella elongata]|uniref:Putative MetA-pathway of phenol degradation n=2 Tax=Bryocella elongata TaxID=863522 RepID=A0A1H5SEV1_9BACT|nr:Putative MetA-pathway of phenol degradation [Bryocella elongata]
MFRMSSILARLLCLVGTLLACSQAHAQAGPPYQTDDPDPVDYHHFEMYAFSLSDSSQHAGTTLLAPSYEMNFGIAPRTQFHFVLPFVNAFNPDGTVTHGVGDIELGVKLKLLPESKLIPETGIFPFVELPTGDASRGLGVGKTWYRVPVWFKKGFQDDKWTEYLGGGEAIVPQTGYYNYPFAGFLSQHKFTEKLVLGVELFGHGAEGRPDVAGDRAILADFGGYYAFGDHFQLLFAGGHSVVWAPETYTYLAAYWTWPKAKEDDKSGKEEASGENLFRAFTH